LRRKVRDATRGSPRSFTARRTLVQDDNRVVGEGDREASQTRDYCVAKNATQRAARPDPSPRKERLLRMTSLPPAGEGDGSILLMQTKVMSLVDYPFFGLGGL
jgi:hypothetical protein